LAENRKGRDHFEDRRVDGRLIAERILKKDGATLWTGFIWLRIGASGGTL